MADRQVAGAKAAVAALALATLGCDASVTSVGAWAPIVEQPEPPSLSLYLEAESGELEGGFATFSDATASNGQYLEASLGTPPAMDDKTPGPARALYRFDAPEDGDYIIWGRIWSPSSATNRFFFQIDGGDWNLWRISVGTIWFWDDFHDDADYYRPLIFPLTAGPHELVIGNAVTEAKLDRLYITADGDEPPGNDTPCYPPHSIDINGDCQPSCGSHGNASTMTSCLTSICQGREIVEAYDCGICCLVPSP